jgi:ubiquinone/menaquinone biosynthesis C-methylase UbiE
MPLCPSTANSLKSTPGVPTLAIPCPPWTCCRPLFERFGLPRSGKLLDIACGEGSFAAAMAGSGWQVSGIDGSPDMIELAQERAQKENVVVDFSVQDMRQPFPHCDVDLITCWYDSLNYLLTTDDLSKVFSNAI